MAKPRRSPRTRTSRNSTSALPRAAVNRFAKASITADARGGWRKPMPEYYDALETRDPAVRAREQFAQLSGTVARAMMAPGWAGHLKNIDAGSVTSRAALAKLPVLRKADIGALQKQNPPFGGLNVTAPGKVRRLLMSPGPIFEPEGAGADWWGAARAFHAAGLRAGDIVHNS